MVLAGSRASTNVDAGSDWDLTVYYRDTLDFAPLAAFGDVHAPGSWGRLMNGGAWLSVDGLAVDVMFRDLAVVEHWTAEAHKGSYELDAVLGYLAGLPTYVLMAELASGRVLAGELPTIAAMPRALVAGAPPRCRFAREFSLEYARMHAARGNAVGATGHAARAVLEEAHARLCARGQWVLNEKRMVGAAGLEAAHALFPVQAGDDASAVGTDALSVSAFSRSALATAGAAGQRTDVTELIDMICWPTHRVRTSVARRLTRARPPFCYVGSLQRHARRHGTSSPSAVTRSASRDRKFNRGGWSIGPGPLPREHR